MPGEDLLLLANLFLGLLCKLWLGMQLSLIHILCLMRDAEPELSGCGNYNLPILSSDGQRTAFNLYFIDSLDVYKRQPPGVGGLRPCGRLL